MVKIQASAEWTSQFPTTFAVPFDASALCDMISNPMRNLLKAITVLLLVLSLGLHWTLLQSMAWTGMLVAYSRDASFQEALVKTFDGQHPCFLCEIVRSGRTEQKNQDQQQLRPVTKLDFGLVWDGFTFIQPFEQQRMPAPDLRAHRRAEAPPKPRPRLDPLPSRSIGA
jgi:hypothetical protein